MKIIIINHEVLIIIVNKKIIVKKIYKFVKKINLKNFSFYILIVFHMIFLN